MLTPRRREIVGGFKCIGQIKNGLWAAFKPDNSRNGLNNSGLSGSPKTDNGGNSKPRKMRDGGAVFVGG
jgi:hypothetical protein